MMGQYTHNLDQKNRLAIPAKLRESLGESFILCLAPNGDHCLFAYSQEDWQGIMDSINQQPPSRKLTMQQRAIHMNADLAETDKQGRITIPQRFIQQAGFEHEVFIFGVGKRVEFWSPSEWARMQAQCEAVDDLALVNFPY